MTAEINITRFFNEATPKDYSASIAEIGRDAGPATWAAAMEDSNEYPLITEENREEFKAYIRGFGAWDDEEIAAMSETALNALCIQMVSGDIREAGLDQESPNWAQYEADSEAGRVKGNLFKGDDGQIYFSIEG